MELSRPSTPEAPPQDLWSSILDSVSSSRSIPSKQILLLGQPSTGKSTLASALLQKPVSDEGKDDHRSDFALGYDFADVRDDADEGASRGIRRKTPYSLAFFHCRYPSTPVCIYCSFCFHHIHGSTSAFPSSPPISPSYTCHDRVGLDASMVFHRRTSEVARMGRNLGER